MIQRTQLHARMCAALTASGMIVLAATSIGKVHAQTQIVEGFVSHGALQWPEYIASEFGWFKESGAAWTCWSWGREQPSKSPQARSILVTAVSLISSGRPTRAHRSRS